MFVTCGSGTILVLPGTIKVIVFGSIVVLPGMIMVLDMAGAPPICRATIIRAIVRLMVAVRSSYPREFLFGVPAVSRWSLSVVRMVAILHTNKNQATHTHRVLSNEELEGWHTIRSRSRYWSRRVLLLFVVPSSNCLTRREDRVRFDPRTFGHDHGTVTAGAPPICRTGHTIARLLAAVRFPYSREFLFGVPAMSRWSLFAWSLSSTQTRTRQHTHKHTPRSLVAKHLYQVLSDEVLEG